VAHRANGGRGAWSDTQIAVSTKPPAQSGPDDRL